MAGPTNKPPMNFKGMAQADVPHGRNGKHKAIVTRILSDLGGMLRTLGPGQCQGRPRPSREAKLITLFIIPFYRLMGSLGVAVIQRHM